MFSFQRCSAMLLAVGLLTGFAFAQDPFSWTHSSIGGGGYCMELRFAPRDNFLNKTAQQRLYLATDISGVYRSEAIDAAGEVTQWARLIDSNPASENDVLPAYTTTLAFTDRFLGQQGNERLIAGTHEGIFVWKEGSINEGDWLRAQQPTRKALDPNNLHMGADGTYPWISIIRQCPPNAQYLAAGIGETRIDSGKDFARYGLSTILRSSDGGNSWSAFKIPQGIAVADSEEVFDIDYIITPNSLNQTLDYIFITTDLGIYVMWDSVNTQTGQVFKTSFRKISNLNVVGNWRALVVLGDAAGVVQTTDSLLIFASRFVKSGSNEGMGIYRLNTQMSLLLDTSYTPVWQEENPGGEKNLGQMTMKPSSRRSSFQVYVGKRNQPPTLCVRADATLDPTQAWHRIYNTPSTNNADNGYREDKTELAFGSLDIHPNDTQANPTIYGCARYGPMLAKGNNTPANFKTMRQIEQMFTTLVTMPAGDAKYFASRGVLDEVNFKGCRPVFHPSTSNIIMVGCPDNGILRSYDGGLTWSQRRLRSKTEWGTLDTAAVNSYRTSRQGVFHIAYHPNNYNLVLASAGPVESSEDGRGELLINIQGGKGTETSWETLAGGPQAGGGTFEGLPDAQIDAFAFDEGNASLVDRNGIFAVVYNHGLYYGKVNGSGNVAQDFQQITDETFTDVFPVPPAGNGNSKHNHFARLLFDPYDTDRNVLYLARSSPSGGVFRIELEPNRLNLQPNNCIVKVEEVIRGSYDKSSPRIVYNANHVADINDLLITSTHVFASASPSKDFVQNQNRYYPGGLFRWIKGIKPDSSVNKWVVGGPPTANDTIPIGIGGLALDPLHPTKVHAVTYAYILNYDHKVDINHTRLQGQFNDKLVNFWHNPNGDSIFNKVTTWPSMTYPNAATMAFFPDDPSKLLVPTKGNGIWIGTRTGQIPKSLAEVGRQLDSTSANLPKRFALHANYPNPFNPTTLIKYDLPRAVAVRLEIFDVLGRKVRTLVDESQPAGYHAHSWDGRDDAGAPVFSGVYFYRLQAARFERVHKMLLLR